MILDSRFLLCWLAPVVAGLFSPYAQGLKHLIAFEGKVAFYGFFVLYLFYALFALIKSPLVVKILKNTLLVLSVLFALVHFFLARYFDMLLTPSTIDTILATNLKESHDFFKSMVLPHSGVLLGVLAVCGLFLYLVRPTISLKPKTHLVLSIVFVLGIGAHIVKIRSVNMKLAYGASQAIERVIPLIREAHAIYTSLKEYGNNQAILQAIREPLPKDYLKVDDDSVPNVVLIVGESASRNFMGVYGYPVPNTPFLSGLAERERERERDRKIYSCLRTPSHPLAGQTARLRSF
ncbi:sulfatase-like hydrolase/transferase [Helicobacter bizzozeronii]|uniref:sulfatase-like hydrolase/transferase n=1 Tax=Helicobacter bizzozeronii TaxID=56877 RepID=UPI000CF16DE3|nr:sulfatase-like hydrolase/transferase [Helicobacter bizzozeronii]